MPQIFTFCTQQVKHFLQSTGTSGRAKFTKKKKAITRIQVDRNSNPWFVLFTVNGTATAHSVNKKLQGKTLSKEYYSKCSGKAQSLDSHDTIYYCSFVPSLSLLSFWQIIRGILSLPIMCIYAHVVQKQSIRHCQQPPEKSRTCSRITWSTGSNPVIALL